MTQIEISKLTPSELAGLGFAPGEAPMGTIEIPSLPDLSTPEKLKPVVGTIDPKLIPAPTPEIVEAARREEAREAGQEPAKEGPTGDQVARFLVHLLGGQPFRETYEYFGGAVRVTCRTLSAYEDELVARECSKMPEGLPPLELMRRYQELGKYLSIESLELRGKPVMRLNHLGGEGSSLQAGRDQFLQSITQAAHGCVLASATRFRDLYNTLMAKAEEPSFWTAASKG